MTRGTQGILLAIGLGSLLILTSCGKKVEPLKLSNATLEGTVTYQGKPVPYALIIVTNGKDTATANADAQGKFKVEHVPLGQVQIGVNTDAGKGAAMGAIMAARQGGGQPPVLVDVPKKYFEPSQSGITTTISDGANTFDIKIE
ncbi:MAG: carboxypeptidase-like regulatory domain-containing protein [Thermogutta sp.]|nr:MAG: hypothetical protein KatS3mg112_1085 [Thermogutta sp.]